jgi:iron complex outermembrane receptor protein
LKFERQISVLFAPEDRVGFNDGMVKWRGNAGLDWNAGPWSLGWNTQYVSDYSLCYSTDTTASCAASYYVVPQGTDRVPSQIYHDAFVRYHFDANAYSVLANTEINLGVQNVFDKSPPILAMSLYSGYGDPRLRRYTLTFRKHFGG